MSSFLFHAHSGLRYLVLLAAVVAIVYLGFGLLTRREHDRGARIVMSAFVGLLDLQILLGIGLVATGVFYPALMGHLMMMVLAAAAAHGLSVLSRKAAEPRRRYGMALAGVVLALLLIVGGITAIGRGVFSSRAMSGTGQAR
jgi:heme A synthase